MEEIKNTLNLKKFSIIHFRVIYLPVYYLKIQILYKTLFSPVVLYECEFWIRTPTYIAGV
jgi:hypothetical protein